MPEQEGARASRSDAATAEAIAWLTRQRDPRFDDWEAFTGWLEADPANAARYETLAALEAGLAADMAADPPLRAPVPDNEGGPWAGRLLPRSIAAAAAALLLVTGLFLWRADRTYEVASAPGLLSDGSRAILAGGTRLRLDHDAPREVGLEHGEALFDVAHDAAAPFRVRFAGGAVEDLGTRFTVRRDGAGTQVAVAEGAVAYRAGADRVVLRPGDRLSVRSGERVLGRIAVEAVGAWATTSLAYQNADLSKVAADLSRELGVPVMVASEVRGQRVTATIQLDADAPRSMARLGPLLGLSVDRHGDGWMLAAPR
jgi:transmembrane sensor